MVQHLLPSVFLLLRAHHNPPCRKKVVTQSQTEVTIAMGKFIWHQWAQLINIFASICAYMASLLNSTPEIINYNPQMSSWLDSGAASSPGFPPGTSSAAHTSRNNWPPSSAGRAPTLHPVGSCQCTPPVRSSPHRTGRSEFHFGGGCTASTSIRKRR